MRSSIAALNSSACLHLLPFDVDKKYEAASILAGNQLCCDRVIVLLDSPLANIRLPEE